MHYKVDVSLKTALCGGQVEIQHVDGQVLTHAVEGIVRPNSEDILEGKGMPVSKQPGKMGDLLVKYTVQFPRRMSAHDKVELANIKYY